MASSELFETLKTALHMSVGPFHPVEYRLGLYYLGAQQSELERFFEDSLRQLMLQAESLVSTMRPTLLDASIGEPDTTFRHGLETVLKMSGALNRQCDPMEMSLAPTQGFLVEQVEKMAAATHDDLTNMRRAVARRIEELPDRALKYHSMASESLLKSLTETGHERNEWLQDAEQRLKEILEQPFGAKDAFTWLNYGWAQARRNASLDSVQHAISQACLCATGQQDEVFRECHRHLAKLLMERGQADGAHLTIQKATLTGASPDVFCEAALYALHAGKVGESCTHFRRLLQEWPIAILMPFASPEHYSVTQHWFGEARNLETRLRQKLKQKVQLARKQLEQTLSEAPPEIDMTAHRSLFEPRIDFAEEHAESASLFELEWFLEDVELAQKGMESAVRKRLEDVVSDAKKETLTLHNQVKLLAAKREEAIYVIRSQAQHLEFSEKKRLNLLNHPDSKVHQGCSLSLLTLGAGYALYFGLCIVFPVMSRSIGPGTATGKLIMLGIPIPAGIGLLIALADSMRRWQAEREMVAAARSIDRQSQMKIDDINRQFDTALAELNQKLEVAQEVEAQALTQLKEFNQRTASPSSKAA